MAGFVARRHGHFYWCKLYLFTSVDDHFSKRIEIMTVFETHLVPGGPPDRDPPGALRDPSALIHDSGGQEGFQGPAPPLAFSCRHIPRLGLLKFPTESNKDMMIIR